MQKFEDQLLPVAYHSITLKHSETKFPAIKLEYLASTHSKYIHTAGTSHYYLTVNH